MINNKSIAPHICSELKEQGYNKNQIQTKQVIEKIKLMGEEAIKYYDLIKDDPFIIDLWIFDFGFICFSAKGTVRYIYIKPSERNKGLCSRIVKSFKVSDPTPEIIHIMDKNDLLIDLKTQGFKMPVNSEEILCYDVKLGYQIKLLSPRLISVAYNKWTGEYFEVVDIILPQCSFKDIRKQMKRNIKKLKTTDSHRIEGGPYGFWNQ